MTVETSKPAAAGKGTQCEKFLSIMIMAIAVAGMASAAPQGTVFLTGMIAQTFNVTITPSIVAGQLILTETTATNDLVIAAAEFATNKNHWLIGVYSLNGSQLLGTTGESLAYTFSLGDVVGMQDITLGTSISPVYTAMTGKTPQFLQNMTISYLGDPLLQEGIYSDSITMTISSD